LRHILNIAQVHGIAPHLKLTTFDADGTLYADGAHMAHDDEMVRRIIDLMCAGVHVAIVTAAGYPDEPERFEERFRGLLDVVGRLGLDSAITDRFHIMGGECNYLLRLDRGGSGLAFVPDAEWKSSALATWREDDVGRLLDDAEALLRRAAARLRLPVRITRKPRAVGVTPTAHTIYEVLEDLALSVRAELQLAKHCVPHCCFNGGN
ncbi:IMP-specific 5'-nucleotidase, partial [Helicosporidium sp. ATCC 50920]